MNKSLFRFDIVLFFVISVLFFISISAFDPFISAYASDLGIQPAVIGSIIGAAGLTSLFTRLPVGILSDILHRRKLFLQIGLLITIVTWTVAFFHPSATTLYIGKLSDGLTSATWVIYNVMFASLFSAREAVKAVAILSVASPVGSLVGSTIGGIIANQYGYEYSFLTAAIAGGLAFVLLFFVKEQAKPAQVAQKYSVKVLTEQLTDRKIWVLAIVGTIAMMVLYGTRDTFTPIVAKDLGANPFIISLLANTHLIFYGAAAALCGSFFYKKLGLVHTAVIGFLLQGVVAMMIPFATGLPILFVMQAIMGVGFGLCFTVVTSLSIEGTPEYQQSTRMGLFQSIYSGGMFFGPVIMGIVTQKFSLVSGFMLIGSVSLIAVVLTKVLIKPVSAENIILNAEEAVMAGQAEKIMN